MKGALLLLAALPDGRTAAARLVGGRLEDLLVDPPPADPAPRPGAIHLGVLGRPMKGAGGSFVDLGSGQSGFLRETRGLAPGRPVLVQIAGWAEAHKAAPVTRRLVVKGRLAILTPGAPGHNLARSTPPEARARLGAVVSRAMARAPDDLGLVLRTAAINAADDQIIDEIAALRDTCSRITASGATPACLLPALTAAEEARRDWPVPGPGCVLEGADAFDLQGVWEAVAALLAPSVPLPTGGRLHVEPTRAHVAVDVDTGGDASPAAALKANLAAARELPRQLRLRGLGGPVLVDFAPLPKKDRQRVADTLKAALAREGIETTLAGWTPLGNLELLRKRARRPLADLLQGALPPGT